MVREVRVSLPAHVRDSFRRDRDPFADFDDLLPADKPKAVPGEPAAEVKKQNPRKRTLRRDPKHGNSRDWPRKP